MTYYWQAQNYVQIEQMCPHERLNSYVMGNVGEIFEQTAYFLLKIYVLNVKRNVSI